MANRTRAIRLACALVGVVAVAAGCFPMAPNTPEGDSSKPPIVPLPDPASMQQVIQPAREFVILNQLQDVTGTFGWVACGGQDEALYYGEVQLKFVLPKGVDENRYIKQIVKMMVSHGWMDTPANGDRSFGTLLHTNEVRAAISGGDSVWRELGKIRLSGECRNTNDHRDDSAGIDITDQVTQR
jgi:hypothetical protein